MRLPSRFFMDYQNREGYADGMGEFLDGSAFDRLSEYFADGWRLGPRAETVRLRSVPGT